MIDNMKNPLEVLGDLYDYQFQYYRWFLHRRVLFSETSLDDVKKFSTYSIFKEDDRENVSSLVTQTTMLGASAGLGAGGLTYAIDTTAKNIAVAKAIRKSVGILLVGAGIGIAYGSLVNFVAKYRDLNDSTNHAVAAMIAFPVTGYYAKANQLRFGMFNGLIAAATLALLKGASNGSFTIMKPAPRGDFVFKNGVHSTHWAPK